MAGTPPDQLADAAAVLDRIERPLFALDEEWRFTYVNEAAERLLQRDSEVLLDRVIWDVLPGLMDTKVPETFHAAVTEAEHREVTTTIAGDRRVEVAAWPGEEGLTVLLSDVTDAYHDEQTTRQYATAFEAAEDPMYVLDETGTIVEVNPAMVELTGYDRDQLVGASMALLLDPEELHRAEHRIRETVLEGEQSVGRIPVEIRTVSGARRPCEASVALLSGEDGVEGTVGVLRDVSARRQREQRLSVLDRVLRHNIRNEMNVVIGRAEIIQDHGGEAVQPHAEKIITTARELVGLSQDIRRFSDAIEPGLGSAKSYDVVETVRPIVEDVRDTYDAEVQLVVREDARMFAHKSVLAAFDELLENAVVHCDVDPEVVVTVEATGPPGRGQVRVSIADNGPGLPEPEREVLTTGDETPLSHASGLGLWLVNWAVTKSGGELEFEANDPRGSVVTVCLPRVHAPDDPDVSDQ